MQHTCTICLNDIDMKLIDYDNQYVETVCNHKFHIKCLQQHFEKTNKQNVYNCPNCRHEIDNSYLIKFEWSIEGEYLKLISEKHTEIYTGFKYQNTQFQTKQQDEFKIIAYIQQITKKIIHPKLILTYCPLRSMQQYQNLESEEQFKASDNEYYDISIMQFSEINDKPHIQIYPTLDFIE